MTDVKETRSMHPIDAGHDPHGVIEYWHADPRDFIDVVWSMQHKGLLPKDIDAEVVSQCIAHSEAVQANALLLAAKLILDSDRLAAVLAQVPELAQQSVVKAKARREPHFDATHLVAAVATAIRDTPETEGQYGSLKALVAEHH